jgi:hypothetical protein
MQRSALLSILALAASLPRLAFAEVVTYEVREVSRIGSRLIAKGTRDYAPSDVQVQPYERDGKHVAEKLLELEQGFKIGARIFSDKDLTGFGLLAQQTDRDFSWEWFSKESGMRFRKLQGGQYVEVQTMRTPFGEELVLVRFLEDTTLGFHPRGVENDTHQILVKVGSVLRFR